MGKIDWRCDAETIRNQVRGLFPWPGAFTCYKNEKMKIAEVSEADCADARIPGRILEADREGLKVATGSGCLYIKRIQFPNQRMMTVDEYLRGHALETNTILGRQER